VSDLTGLSKVKSVEDRGEKDSATTPVWAISLDGVVELDDEGSSWTLWTGELSVTESKWFQI
jgi:hypothetical protein